MIEITPVVSVIMAVKGPAPWLEAAIQSVEVQSFTCWELLVVLDGPDEEILNTLARHNDIRVVALPKSIGAADARNAGVAVARGEYLAILDSDDVWPTDHLAYLVNYLDGHRDTVLVSTSALVIDEEGRILGSRGRAATGDRRRQLLWRNQFIHSSVLVRAKPLRKSGGWRSGLTVVEDYELWLRMGGLGSLDLLGFRHVFYRIHPQQTSHRPVSASARTAILRSRRQLAAELGIPIAVAELAHFVWTQKQTASNLQARRLLRCASPSRQGVEVRP